MGILDDLKRMVVVNSNVPAGTIWLQDGKGGNPTLLAKNVAEPSPHSPAVTKGKPGTMNDHAIAEQDFHTGENWFGYLHDLCPILGEGCIGSETWSFRSCDNYWKFTTERRL